MEKAATFVAALPGKSLLPDCALPIYRTFRAEPRALPRAEPRALPRAEPRALPRAEPRALPRAEPRALPRAEPRALERVSVVEAGATGVLATMAFLVVFRVLISDFF